MRDDHETPENLIDAGSASTETRGAIQPGHADGENQGRSGEGLTAED